MAAEALRARALHCPASGAATPEYLDDAVLVLDGARIASLLPAAAAAAKGLDLGRCRDLRPALLVPGFIDTHVHAPQLDIIASHGEQLLEWLERYTFPAEGRFADEGYAATAMDEFVQALLDHGTTSAMVHATSHEHATEALFSAAAQRDLCLIGGKVLMDRNAPEPLRDATKESLDASRRLIERWHGHGRLAYAVTPRFAVTSTPAQLFGAGQLLREYPGLYMQTHLSENLGEVSAVRRLFPEAAHYLDVYDRHGLCIERAVYAHCLHLDASERRRLAESGGCVAFCPTSNLFLGSGLFDWDAFEALSVPVTLASDVGAGTSLCMLGTLADAYKVCQLQGRVLDPLEAFAAITLGNARALGLEHRVGTLEPGTDADFLVLDGAAVPQLARRLAACRDIREEWFVLMMLGDARVVRQTWVAGRPRAVAA